jgi:hypothetical protein
VGRIFLDYLRNDRMELDAEIHAQSDEQHEKSHRNQVQRANQEKPPRRGNRQTHGDAEGHGEDNARRAQRQPFSRCWQPPAPSTGAASTFSINNAQ